MLLTNAFNIFELLIEVSVGLMFLMTISLLAGLVVVRSRNARYQRQHQILTTNWRDIFKTVYSDQRLPDRLPEIGKHERFAVFSLFVQFHDVREKDRPRTAEVHRKLDDLAVHIGLANHAASLLEQGDDGDKILALEVIGRIRDTRSLKGALELTAENGAELSRAAAHCALRIDRTFIGEFLQLLLRRDDWVRSRVEAMLREVDPANLGLAMLGAMNGASEKAKVRLLDYVRFCPPATAHHICTDVLTDSVEAETLAAALRSLAPLTTESDHDTAVHFVNSGDPIIALSALRMLRKCVRAEDRDLIVKMLSSRDYWVRLRAAEVATQLIDSSLIDEFAEGLADRYARDAIKQVLAEQAMNARRLQRPDRRIPQFVEAAA